MDNKFGYGSFGKLTTAYKQARRGFPEGVFELLADLTSNKKSDTKVLDIGCGTGISTRQLASHGWSVTGADRDQGMLKAAEEYGTSKIRYFCSPADDLPFLDEDFGLITAFSSLHWFSNPESLLEIRRVLKVGGRLYVVNKNDVLGFVSEYKNIIQKYIDSPLPTLRSDYNPSIILRDSNFKEIRKHVFPVSESYSLTEAVTYIQSVSLWNLIPEYNKSIALDAIEEMCSLLSDESGQVKRDIEVTVVTGIKG